MELIKNLIAFGGILSTVLTIYDFATDQKKKGVFFSLVTVAFVIFYFSVDSQPVASAHNQPVNAGHITDTVRHVVVYDTVTRSQSPNQTSNIIEQVPVFNTDGLTQENTGQPNDSNVFQPNPNYKRDNGMVGAPNPNYRPPDSPSPQTSDCVQHNTGDIVFSNITPYKAVVSFGFRNSANNTLTIAGNKQSSAKGMAVGNYVYYVSFIDQYNSRIGKFNGSFTVTQCNLEYVELSN